MAEIVPFRADGYDQAQVIAVLEGVLERARAGEVADVAVLIATRSADGPGMAVDWHGEAQFSALITAAEMFRHQALTALMEQDEE